MPFIRSLAFKCWAKLIFTIILLSEIMPSYFCYIKRRLLYIIIAALFSHQFFFYTKCAQANIWASYNIHSVLDAERIFLAYLINFQSLQLPYLIYYRVLRVGYRYKVKKSTLCNL